RPRNSCLTPRLCSPLPAPYRCHSSSPPPSFLFPFFFFFNATATTELSTLSLHDALPIFLTASKQFRHGATSKSRSNTASNSTKHKSPHLSGWRQIISLIT